MAKQQSPFIKVFITHRAIRIRRDAFEEPPRYVKSEAMKAENRLIVIKGQLDIVTLKNETARDLIAWQAARRFKQEDFDEFKEELEEQERANEAGRKKKQSSSPDSSSQIPEPGKRRSSRAA